MRRRSSGRSTVVTPGIAWVRGRYGAIFWAALTAGFRVGLLPAGVGVPDAIGQFNSLAACPQLHVPTAVFAGGQSRGGDVPVRVSVGAGRRLPVTHLRGRRHVIRVRPDREVVTPGFLRLRARAATTIAAAVSIEMPASLRQRRLGGFAGSSRCAAEDHMAETLAATLSRRTRPVRSTMRAAQARVLCTLRLAAAPVLLASGFTGAAAGCTRAAARRARSRALLAGLSASSLLEMRDMETSASVLSLGTLPPAGHVNHLVAAANALGFGFPVAVSTSFNMFRTLRL